MSNNIDKFNKKEIQIAPKQTGATTQTHAHNNTLNIGNELNGSSNNNTLATLLNSEEFIALSYEEKIAKLQELYPQLKPAEIANILPKENIEGEAENIMIEETVDETEAPASQFDGVKVFQFGSGMMSSADTFDRNEILEGIDDASKELKDSPDWDKKSPAEKLNDRLDAYLATKVGHYDKLDEEDKQDEREHLIAQITDNENFEQLSDIDKLYETLNLARDFEMLESEEGFSIKQYLEMQENDPDTFHELKMIFTNRAMEDNFVNNPDIDIWYSELEKLGLKGKELMIAEAVYRKFDPNLDEETLQKLGEKLLDNLALRSGIDENSDIKNKLYSQTKRASFVNELFALKVWNAQSNTKYTISDLKNYDKIYSTVMVNYTKVMDPIPNDNSEESQALNKDQSDYERLYNDVAQSGFVTDKGQGQKTGKQQDQITGKTIHDYLQDKINREGYDELPDYEKRQYKYYKEKVEYSKKNANKLERIKRKAGEIGIDNLNDEEKENYYKYIKPLGRITPPSETIGYQVVRCEGNTFAEKIDNWCQKNGITKEEFAKMDKHQQNRFIGHIAKTDPDIAYYLGQKFGMSKDELNRAIPMNQEFEEVRQSQNGLRGAITNAIGASRLDNPNRYEAQRDHIDDMSKSNIPLAYRLKAQAMVNSSKESAESMGQFIAENRSKEEATIYGSLLANNNLVSIENRGAFTTSVIEHAPNDEFRYEFGTGVAQNTTNPDILEYLGAATQYFESDNYRYQYINTLTTVAQNYSPEVQQAVQTAIQTGTVSNTNVVEAEALSVSRSTNSTSSSTAAQASAQGNAQPASAPAQSSAPANTPSAAAATPIQNTAAAQETQQGLNYTPSSVTINPVTFSSRYDDEVSVQASDKTNKTTPASSNSKVESKKIDDAKWVEEANAKKQEILDKIAEVKQAIDDAKEEWEIKHQLQLTDEEWKIIESELAIETAVDGLDDTKMPQTEKSRIIAKLKAATSFNERFNILLSAFGKRFEDRFIERLASRGSVDRINEFLSHRGTDTNILKTLYLRCSGEGIKKELLGMLPSETVEEMLASGDITNIVDVNYKIIQSYVLKNIYSMSNSDFTKYLKYLPLDIREKLTEERNIARGNINNPIKANGEAHQADMPSVVTTQSTKPQNNTTADKKAQQPMSQTNGLFKNGETTVKLADGRFATKNGTSFGAISDNDYSDSYRIIDPKEEGAPIGMNDEVLTPGSVEWNKKYNHNNVAATSFTMAALDNEEESDDFGIPFGSNKVGMGKKIKKKYKPGGFNTKG